MNKEERMAMKYLKQDIKNMTMYWDEKLHREAIDLIVNLIKRQDKEIRELKRITNTYDSFYANTDHRIVLADQEYFDSGIFIKKYISKDKIKSKIEKIKQAQETTQKLFDRSLNEYIYNGQINILKELLEDPNE